MPWINTPSRSLRPQASAVHGTPTGVHYLPPGRTPSVLSLALLPLGDQGFSGPRLAMTMSQSNAASCHPGSCYSRPAFFRASLDHANTPPPPAAYGQRGYGVRGLLAAIHTRSRWPFPPIAGRQRQSSPVAGNVAASGDRIPPPRTLVLERTSTECVEGRHCPLSAGWAGGAESA